MLKRAVNAPLHALRSHKRGQFGGLLHKMRVWATGGGAGMGRAKTMLFAEGGASVVITRRCSEPLDFGFMTLFDYL